jgi:hypothetical protein
MYYTHLNVLFNSDHSLPSFAATVFISVLTLLTKKLTIRFIIDTILDFFQHFCY